MHVLSLDGLFQLFCIILPFPCSYSCHISLRYILIYSLLIVTSLFAKSSLFHLLGCPFLTKKSKILSRIYKEMNRYFYLFKDFINIEKESLGNLNCIEKPESLQNIKILHNVYCKRQITKQIRDVIKPKIHKVPFIPQLLQETLLSSAKNSSQTMDHQEVFTQLKCLNTVLLQFSARLVYNQLVLHKDVGDLLAVSDSPVRIFQTSQSTLTGFRYLCLGKRTSPLS